MLQFLASLTPLWGTFPTQLQELTVTDIVPSSRDFCYCRWDGNTLYSGDNWILYTGESLKGMSGLDICQSSKCFHYLTDSGILYTSPGSVRTVEELTLREVRRNVASLYEIGDRILYLTADHQLILRGMDGQESVLGGQVYGIRTISGSTQGKPYSVVRTLDDRLYHISNGGTWINHGTITFYAEIPYSYLYTRVDGKSFLNDYQLWVNSPIVAVGVKLNVYLIILTECRTVYDLILGCTQVVSVLPHPRSEQVQSVIFEGYQHLFV